MREYDEIRLKNTEEKIRRTNHVYDLIPEYKLLDESVSKISMEYAKASILHGKKDSSEYTKKINEISKRKSELLKSASLDENYLDDIYDCDKCRDTGFVDDEKCSCFKQREIKLLYNDSNMQKISETASFDDIEKAFYTGDDLENFNSAYRGAINFVNEFLIGDPPKNGLLFFGSVGTGKTFLSSCIANKLISNGIDVLYYSSINLFTRLADYNFGNDHTSRIDFNNKLYLSSLLIIDDLGTEITNAFTGGELFAILNARCANELPTIISTNLSLKQLQDIYGDRIFSRIVDKFSPYKFTGDDIRIKRKVNA